MEPPELFAEVVEVGKAELSGYSVGQWPLGSVTNLFAQESVEFGLFVWGWGRFLHLYRSVPK